MSTVAAGEHVAEPDASTGRASPATRAATRETNGARTASRTVPTVRRPNRRSHTRRRGRRRAAAQRSKPTLSTRRLAVARWRTMSAIGQRVDLRGSERGDERVESSAPALTGYSKLTSA